MNMHRRVAWICSGLASLGLCLSALSAPQPEPARVDASPATPRALFPDLFDAVQNAHVFADGKTFADAVPKAPPAQILAGYRAARPATPDALKAFVEKNFSLPSQANGAELPVERVGIAQHIDSLWNTLSRS